jgi:ABC-type branched-subunit amino acid transport system substrate-binding protein
LVVNGAALAAAGWVGPLRAQPSVVKFGQSASLTGGQASYGKDVRDGILAAFNAANRADPKGPRFELTTLDDGGDKERCKTNVKQLVDSGVTALVGLTSGAAAEACMPFVEEQRVVLLGTASGNMGIRGDKLTMAYHVRTGYDDEYHRMLSYIKSFNMRRLGYVHLKDTSAANQAAMTKALKAVGLEMTVSVALDRNSKNFDAEVRKLLDARLDCVLFTTNSQPILDIMSGMAIGGYPGFYFASSFAGQTLIDAMANKGRSVIMSQVVPRPSSVSATVVKRCHEDLAALGSGARMGFTSLEGYIAGRVAIEAAKAGSAKSGGNQLTRSRFQEALSELNVDLGGYRVHFAPQKLEGSHFVDVIAVDRTGRIIG